MTAILTRAPSSDKGTFGILCLGNIPLCVTCEDPWNDNKPNISCIPAGHYQCTKFNGARFSDVWEILNVPKRSAILIHNGNTIADTHGCVLVGSSFGALDGMPGVMDSVKTLTMLRHVLPDMFDLIIR